MVREFDSIGGGVEKDHKSGDGLICAEDQLPLL